MVPLRPRLHLLEARVVIGELVQMRERDLPRDQGVVVADVRRRISDPMLEFNIHADAKLFDVERCRGPVAADPRPDPTRFHRAETFTSGHFAPFAPNGFFWDRFTPLMPRHRGGSGLPRGLLRIRPTS